MKRDWDDDAMRQLFAEVRTSEADGAPPFDATLATAHAVAGRRPAPTLGRRIGALAAALLVASGVWLAWHPHRVAPVSLSQWRSPTAFLLDGPGDALVRTLPSISASAGDHL